jgi:hypothetical protein
MRLPQFDRAEVARHNDAAQGYWLVIDRLVYDVTEFMHAHPGGERILRLYAGRDATHGFQRAHADRRQAALRLERHRIGALRPSACDASPEHAAHHLAFRALYSSLELVVEMQNALAVDHSFRLEPLDAMAGQAPSVRRSRFELQRGVETHARFHREYLDVWMGDRLVLLASSFSPAPGHDTRALIELESLQRSVECVSARARALELFDQLERFSEHELTAAVARFEVQDSSLLRNWKRELARGLRGLERPHAAMLPPSEVQFLYGVCDRMLEHLRHYFRSAATPAGAG